MTTRKQIQRLFALLSDCHPDLEVVGDLLVLKPVHHFARAILIDRTRSADMFQPQTSSTHLCCGIKNFPLGTGVLLRRDQDGPTRLWLWSDPSMPDVFIRVVERDALPQLRAIQTLEDYYRYSEFIHREHFPYYFSFRLVLYIALGRLDEAREVLNDGRASDCLFPLNHYSPGLGDRLREQGARISAGDRALLADALHKWEAQSVEKLNFGTIWQRTPFPLELAGAPDRSA